LTEAAPVIVIFVAAVRPDGSPSTALRRRVEAAFAFGRTFPAADYLPTGGVGRHGPSEASVMGAMLRAWDVPAARIRLEETGTDTLSSARAVARMLRGRNGKVFVSSNAYHQPRCVALLLLAGIPSRSCPPPPGPAAHSFRRRWFWRLREAAALPYDCALMAILRLTARI